MRENASTRDEETCGSSIWLRISLTFLLDHEDLVVDLLAQQDRMQIVEEGLQMLRSIAKWNDYGDAMPGDAVRGPTCAARLHLHE